MKENLEHKKGKMREQKFHNEVIASREHSKYASNKKNNSPRQNEKR